MKSVQYLDIETVQVAESPDPEILTVDDVLVRVTMAGICGSDLHLYRGHIPGMVSGSIMGHEFTGQVIAVGDRVRQFSVGDRVVGTFHVACGVCDFCRMGQFHQCRQGSVFGYGAAFGDLPGAQAEIVRVPFGDINLRKIPDSLSDDRALFCGDILTTAFGAVRNAQLQPGETCAIIGAGPVGLMAVMVAGLMGASQVFSIDRDPVRVGKTKTLGAIPVDSSRTNPMRRILQQTHGMGADVVIEAVGGPQTIGLAFQLVRGGGRIVAIGVTSEAEFRFPLMTTLTRDVSFRIGLANIHRDIDQVMRLVASGRLDPTVVVSHRLSLDEAPEGYSLFHQQKATKVLLSIG